MHEKIASRAVFALHPAQFGAIWTGDALGQELRSARMLQLMDEEEVEVVTVEQVKAFLRVHDKKYPWLAAQLGVAPSTVNQWLRPTDPTPFPNWAAVSAARLFRQFEPSDTELGRDEMELLTRWAEQEGIGPIRLAVRILREEIEARRKKRP